jgi:hypothetical protein
MQLDAAKAQIAYRVELAVDLRSGLRSDARDRHELLERPATRRKGFMLISILPGQADGAGAGKGGRPHVVRERFK